jgi:hypothetical protein
MEPDRAPTSPAGGDGGGFPFEPPSLLDRRAMAAFSSSAEGEQHSDPVPHCRGALAHRHRHFRAQSSIQVITISGGDGAASAAPSFLTGAR